MPTLADIYSAADSFKRRLADAAMNPSASLQQMLGYANDRARNFNELQQQATGEVRQGGFANQGPATQALNQEYAESLQPVGMTVWHGSPHVFEKFDLSKMGTGEGAQVYGKGLYMAQSPDVAKNYQNALKFSSKRDITNNGEYLAQKALEATNMDKDQAIKMLTSGAIENTRLPEFAAKNVIENLHSRMMNPEGALYKVDLPDTHIRRMLDWDAPLKEQPSPVRKLAKSLGMDMNDLGGDLVAKVGKGESGKQIMEKAGIRGIKYFDQMSRGDQTGSRNFVVFDPNHLTILERNAKPIK
jgi:hypothetical protein